jgi:hypothetical protein
LDGDSISLLIETGTTLLIAFECPPVKIDRGFFFLLFTRETIDLHEYVLPHVAVFLDLKVLSAGSFSFGEDK